MRFAGPLPAFAMQLPGKERPFGGDVLWTLLGTGFRLKRTSEQYMLYLPAGITRSTRSAPGSAAGAT